MHLAGRLDLAALTALVAVAGTVRGLADCATIPLVTPIANLGQVPFERAAGPVYSAANRTAMLVGMSLSGAMIAAVGAANVVLVDAVSFAASTPSSPPSCPPRVEL